MFKDTFAVIDCNHDLIIGLPSIVKNVLPRSTDALFAAKDRMTDTEKSTSVNLLIENPWSFIDE